MATYVLPTKVYIYWKKVFPSGVQIDERELEKTISLNSNKVYS
jgi:hypothetical protein